MGVFHKFDKKCIVSFFNSKFRNYIFFNVFLNSFVYIAVIRQFFHKFDRHALSSFFNSKFRNYIFFNVFVNSFVCNAVIRQFNLLVFMKKEFKIVISLHLDILFLL